MTKNYVCEIEYINKKAVQAVKSVMLGDEFILELAGIFKILGDSTRIKILYALSQRELCVCELSVLLGMTQSAISHQLSVLRISRLVKFRKEGKIVYYSISDEHVIKLLEMGVKHAKEKVDRA